MKSFSIAAVAFASTFGSADASALATTHLRRHGHSSIFTKLRQQQQPQSDDDTADAQTASAGAQAKPAATPSVAVEAVPAPADVGTDGFPVLPAVSAMTDATSETMKSLNSQASILEARIAQMQMENEAKLARQKAIFETKLKAQEVTNREVREQNQHISAEIATLTDANGNLTKQAKNLEDENHLGRVELKTLQAKLKLVREFLDESLEATSDRGAEVLEVLQRSGSVRVAKKVKTPPPATTELSSEADKDQESDDNGEDGDETSNEQAPALVQNSTQEEGGEADAESTDAQDDQEGEATSDDDEEEVVEEDEASTSFLALKSQVHRMRVKEAAAAGEALGDGAMSEIEEELLKPLAKQEQQAQLAASPRDLLKVLSSNVDGLAQEQQANGAKLKKLFLAAYKAGNKRHTALLSQQKSLNATRSELSATQTKLKGAVNHLETTHEHLAERLRGVGLFMQRLGHLAIAPVAEAKHLLKNLPSKVAPAKAKEH
eukprot:TRINITY_DN9302_c0_g1_i1.p2 TRINITY_DN9302_c0_g1~~TRINITY_DN9302_c0_g1_i1.p2  ORF type:complete len:492 (+),score=208.30 TRINITY_DN9302_c0_g1_i1:80-1555(+)